MNSEPARIVECFLLVVLGGAWPGMVRVETIGRIRRAFWVDKKPIRQIVWELRVWRQTVRKAVRGSSTEFRYERQIQPQPRLGLMWRASTRCWRRTASVRRASG